MGRVRLIRAAMLGVLGGCAPSPGQSPPVVDITEAIVRAHSQGREYQVRPLRGGEVECTCLFDWEDDRTGAHSRADSMERMQAVCANPSDLRMVYSPLPLTPERGLLVLFLRRGDRAHIEYQTFSRDVPWLAAVTTLYAAGCSRGQAVIRPEGGGRRLKKSRNTRSSNARRRG